MKRILNYADDYIKSCSWKDIVLLKLCLCSIGVIIGLKISPKYKKASLGIAIAVYAATYIPIMSKFLAPALKKYTDSKSHNVL